MNTIFITGANRGIGFAFAKLYLQSGWRVLAACRDLDTATDLYRLQQRFSEQLTLHQLDLCNDSQIQQLAPKLANQPIDILLNNAGIFGPSGVTFGKVNAVDWFKVLRINTISPVLLSQVLINNVLMSKQKIIAFISSWMGSITENSEGGRYYYRSSKTALNCVMKNMSIDLAEQNVITVALHPGWVKTNFGGADAPLSPDYSVKRLKRIFDNLSLKDSGKFYAYDGTEIAW